MERNFANKRVKFTHFKHTLITPKLDILIEYETK